MSLFDRLQNNRAEKVQAEKEAGAAFMQTNSTKEGVQLFENTIQYKVLQQGTGDKPAPNATIKAHYAGRLLNGTEFDSSFKRGQPFTAPLNALIKGWQKIIPQMPVGSRWQIWIPSNLAYGDGGQSSIPGGAVLEFEIELLEIVGAK
ncbi:MAG TPA: FKBP-type peptidyl-prolyl cis-trans isomerase [Chitinophagaceae bacterium]|nr:FKBP-type peptidyl-prolyl cis-trans isomerase [Chitinophagaceae bacterium]